MTLSLLLFYGDSNGMRMKTRQNTVFFYFAIFFFSGLKVGMGLQRRADFIAVDSD